MNEKQIQKQAKQILDKFAKSLDNVKISSKKSSKKLSGFREESTPLEPNEDFKKLAFQNAPDKEGDFFIAEKKKW